MVSIGPDNLCLADLSRQPAQMPQTVADRCRAQLIVYPVIDQQVDIVTSQVHYTLAADVVFKQLRRTQQ